MLYCNLCFHIRKVILRIRNLCFHTGNLDLLYRKMSLHVRVMCVGYLTINFNTLT